MIPSITFHDIFSIRLTPVEQYGHTEDNSAFASRKLVMTDRQGESYTLVLTADRPENLALPDEADNILPADGMTEAEKLQASYDAYIAWHQKPPTEGVIDAEESASF